jgi:hypothetical protein
MTSSLTTSIPTTSERTYVDLLGTHDRVRRAAGPPVHPAEQQDQQDEEQDRREHEPVDVRHGEDVERPPVEDAIPEVRGRQSHDDEQPREPATTQFLPGASDVREPGVDERAVARHEQGGGVLL